MPALTAVPLSDSVAQHMRRDFTHVRSDQTVSQALAGVRENPPEGRIIYFYVLDGDGRLCGVVPTRRLLLSAPDRPIGEIMVREVIVIPATATVLDACEFFTLHRLLAFPVVDDDGRMLGVVDVELYTEELGDIERSQRQDDLFQLIGVHLSSAQAASALAAFRSRFPWLLCNISGGILAAFLTGLYERELEKAVALALFIPVVLALAESVSIQSVSLALQWLHRRPLTPRHIGLLLRTELLTGILLGIASGLLIGLVAYIWQRQTFLVLALLGGIAGGVAAAAVIGLAMPIALRLFRREPQVAAGPVALALADMITLLIYFNLARWLLG